MSTPSPLALYESMSTLSAQMVHAATASNWERLTALEKDCAGLARQLDGDAGPILLNDAERARKRDLILKILADDAEVRRHTETWMAQVKPFLTAGVRGNKVRRAYGAAGQ